MIYLISLAIVLVLSYLEISFLPYFSLFNVSAFITLSFLVALAVRSRDYFQILLSVVAGIIFDFASSGFVGQYTIIFVSTTLLGRMFFYQKTSYKNIYSFSLLLLLSAITIYLVQFPILFDINFLGWQRYVFTLIYGTLITIIVGLIMYGGLNPYFNWLERKTEK